MRWLGLSRALAEVLSLGAAVVLARLVSPAQFGLLAMALIVRELAMMTANEAIGAPLVQRKEMSKRHVEAGQAVAIGSGTLFFALTLFVVPLVTRPLLGSGATQLFQLFAPAFLLAGAMIVPLALLQRALDFRRIAIVEVAGVFVSSAAAVGLALAGLGAKAYVLGVLLGLVLSAVAFTLMTRPPLPRWHRREAAELLHFGIPAAAAGLAGVSYRNADYLILGVKLSPALVGLYYRAFTLGVEYEAKVSAIVTRIAFPVYSRTESMSQMRAIRERVVRANATLIWPLLAGLIVMAPELVPFVFGENWTKAVEPTQILAVAGMASTIRSGTSPVLLATGRPRTLLVVHLLELVGYVIVVLIAAPHGLVTVAAAVSAFGVLNLVLVYALVLGPKLDISLGALGRDVAPAGISSIALLGAAAALSQLAGGLPTVPYLAIVGFGGAAAYALTLRLLFRSAWNDLILLASPIVRRSSKAGA